MQMAALSVPSLSESGDTASHWLGDEEATEQVPDAVAEAAHHCRELDAGRQTYTHQTCMGANGSGHAAECRSEML